VRSVTRRLALTIGVVLTTFAAVATATPAGAARRKPKIATSPYTMPTSVPLADTPPPWDLPADARPYVAAAGLSVLSQEQLDVHYHAHVDVIDAGKKVTVPAGIGFVVEQGKVQGITVLHTHDTSGVLHIESAKKVPYTLGQAFTEWGVALSATQVGGLHADATHVVRAYVNGHRFKGDPATIRLERHLEIALWYGPAGTKPTVPKSHHFPAGL
jgi:hypothetical protein